MCTVEPIKDLEKIAKIEQLLTKRRDLKYLLIFVIGINCGLRISDILNLDVSDVIDNEYIDITEQKTGKRKKFPINKKLKPKIYKFTEGRSASEPLFKSNSHNSMERTQCYRMFVKICRQAGVKAKIGTHTLRKTFGYHHYKKFKDIALLQKIFNHSSPVVTLRYIGIDQDVIDESYLNFVL